MGADRVLEPEVKFDETTVAVCRSAWQSRCELRESRDVDGLGAACSPERQIRERHPARKSGLSDLSRITEATSASSTPRPLVERVGPAPRWTGDTIRFPRSSGSSRSPPSLAAPLVDRGWAEVFRHPSQRAPRWRDSVTVALAGW